MTARLAVAAVAVFTMAMSTGLLVTSAGVMDDTPTRIPVTRGPEPFIVVATEVPRQPIRCEPNEVWVEQVEREPRRRGLRIRLRRRRA